MKLRARLIFLLLLAPFCLVHGAAATGQAPALNWVVHAFSDNEGYRLLSARGSEVRPGLDDTVIVTNLNITVYTGDETARVETVFLSPLARFFPKTNRASGDKTVRVVRDDLEATAQKWEYDQKRKHVTLEGNGRIVMNAAMKDLLK